MRQWSRVTCPERREKRGEEKREREEEKKEEKKEGGERGRRDEKRGEKEKEKAKRRGKEQTKHHQNNNKIKPYLQSINVIACTTNDKHSCVGEFKIPSGPLNHATFCCIILTLAWFSFNSKLSLFLKNREQERK